MGTLIFCGDRDRYCLPNDRSVRKLCRAKPEHYSTGGLTVSLRLALLRVQRYWLPSFGPSKIASGSHSKYLTQPDVK